MDKAILSANAQPIENGDCLRIRFYHTGDQTQTWKIVVIALDPHGNLEKTVETVSITAALNTIVKLIPLSAGLLISISIQASGATRAYGLGFAMIELQRGEVATTGESLRLASGPIGSVQPLKWPQSPTLPEVPLAATSQTWYPATPPVGEDWSFTFPTTSQVRLLSFTLRLFADATVANRIPLLSFSDQGDIRARVVLRTAVTAGQNARIYGWKGPNMPADDTTFNTYFIPVPDLGWTRNLSIVAITDNLQATDAWDASNVCAESAPFPGIL
jgi:hypothetical protein